ncbi:MAG: FtsX-like permease family protein, partial [Bdellovibrio sp.]|nr:FtsX-like permease family protein [Bdellovibrio sp.]
MRLKYLLKLVWIELFRFKRVTTFLVLNFALGLVGFFLLQIFQQSLSVQTAEKAQIILGGDLTINARKSFTDAERTGWEKTFTFEKKSQTFSMFAMLRGAGDSRLVNVVVFDENYPLYGSFKLSNRSLNSDQSDIWVDPEVKDMLKVKLDDKMSLGEGEFKLAGTIDEDPSRLFRAGGFAPRVLISKKYLEASKLVQTGSTFNERWSYLVPKTEDISKLKGKVEKQITDPVVQIETTNDTLQEGNRALKYFTDYLGLVALVALGLCFLCGSYLLQWVFNSKRKNIAILKTLGLDDLQIISIYTLQTLLISIFSCLIAVAFVGTALPLLQSFLMNKFDLPVVLQLNWKAILIISVIGILGPMLMTVPQVLQIFNLHPLQLLQNSFVQNKKSRWYYIWLIVSVVIFWLLAIWQSQSYKIGSGFVAGILVLIVIFYLFNISLLKVLDRLSSSFSWLVQYGIKGLTRRAASTGLVFITMSLSTLVLSLLPHIKASILHEIRPDEGSQIPNLFMFDIQPDQVDGLEKVAKRFTGKELVFSP